MVKFLLFCGILIGGILFVRTFLWHLQCWQIRWYRADRMRGYLSTDSGKKNLLNVWFFTGILPRPKLTGRIILIALMSVMLCAVSIFGWNMFVQPLFESQFIGWLVAIFVLERLTWLVVVMAVFVSSFPRHIFLMRLYGKARKIRFSGEKLTVIGITGSYGKTSTKLMIEALLKPHFGSDNVFVSPKNINSEIGLARLMIEQAEFFARTKEKRIFVAEIGACARGEIKTACSFILPDVSVITAIGDQHLELFGSQRNIQLGKWELAEAAKAVVFYNRESKQLAAIADEKKDFVSAQVVPVTPSKPSVMSWSGICFEYQNYKYTLPWLGKFWEMNALLAVAVGAYCGVEKNEMKQALMNLAQPKNALHIDVRKKRPYTVLSDLYSANTDGVLAAIGVLATAPGQKIYVGTPLIELGVNEEKVHRAIFESLHAIGAEVYWAKSDWVKMGKEICGDKFMGNDVGKFKQKLGMLKKYDCLLLEGRLPADFVV